MRFIDETDCKVSESYRCVNASGVTDGGEGVRAAPPGRLNAQNGPPC